MKVPRKQIKYMLQPDKADRFNQECRELKLMPSHQVEELMDLWLDYIAPKLREGGNG
jgi:hypothetical protein